MKLLLPLLTLTALLTAVAATGTLIPGDRTLADALQATPGGRFAEPLADWLALRWLRYLVLATAVAMALRARAYALAAAGLLVVAASTLNAPIKDLIERPRPSATDLIIREPAPGFGYPSGHAMSAMLFYGYTAIVAARLGMRAQVMVAVVACAIAVALIGWDRVYDGAHWPSDVAGGFAIGGLLLWCAVRLPAAFLRWRTRTPSRAHRSSQMLTR